MKTPILTFNANREVSEYENRIRKVIYELTQSQYNIDNLVSSACCACCYKSFYLGNESYVHGKSYLIRDVCITFEKRLLREDAISILTQLAFIGNTGYKRDLYENLLDNPYIYEILGSLTDDACNFYAMLLLCYSKHESLSECFSITLDFLVNQRVHYVHDYENLYLAYQNCKGGA